MATYLETLENERVTALVMANESKGKLAFGGDGEGYDFGPVTCKVCGAVIPFDEAHEVVTEGNTRRCTVTGKTIAADCDTDIPERAPDLVTHDPWSDDRADIESAEV